MGDTRITMEPNFGGEIGDRLNKAVNQAISEVQDSRSGHPHPVVHEALLVALDKAWPSGIYLSKKQMHRLVVDIANGTYQSYKVRLA